MRFLLSLVLLIASSGLVGSAVAQIGGNSVTIDGMVVGEYLLFEMDNDEGSTVNNGDIQLTISGSGALIKESPLISGTFGVTEIVWTEGVSNGLAVDITDYHMELGWIIGGAFVPSTPGDGLDFDWWLPGDPVACFGVPPLTLAGPCNTPPPDDEAFPTFFTSIDNTSSEDELWFSGFLSPPDQAQLRFAVDVPAIGAAPSGATRWAIRQVALVPEPASTLLWLAALATVASLAASRRRSAA